MTSRHPVIAWAQRSEQVFLTVELPDAQNPKVNIEPEGKFTFSATAGPDNHHFEIEVELFDNINIEGSKINLGSRHVFCILQKHEKGWWKRLLKAEGKPPPFVRVDWNKWVDEDDEESPKFNNFDFSGMDNLSKPSDVNEEVGSDDDDDEGMLYLPDLQEQAKSKA